MIIENKDSSKWVVGDEYRINIKFENWLNKLGYGFFESYYHDADGGRHYLAATQFQSIGARKAFPCFDEPSLRAYFHFQSKFFPRVRQPQSLGVTLFSRI